MNIVQITIWFPWIVGFGIYLSISIAAAIFIGAFIQAGRGPVRAEEDPVAANDLLRLGEAVGRPVPVDISAYRDTAASRRS